MWIPEAFGGSQLSVNVTDDLSVEVGGGRARVSPGEAFRLAERLIRAATVAMITEEVDARDASALARRQRGASR